ncbi:PAS domain-containing protein [Actinoplanes sp. NPDC048791]|uniref:PAS domain-containing protein n=1 Tax=Actinoplanes sp. NPDC048791 TaxID=3154623 RepID=UPI00340177C5
MLQAIEWIHLGAVGVAAIIFGICRHKPARIGPWLLLTASVVAVAIGDILHALHKYAAADIAYLAMFALVALSLLQLTRAGAILMDRARVIDLVAFACAALLVIWVFLIGGSSWLGGIAPEDMLGALLLVGICARLIVAVWFNWSAVLLGVGALGCLGSDIAYSLAPSSWSEAGYMLLYLAWGGAALHPSMVQLTTPLPMRPKPWQGRWATLLGLSVATPPLVLLIEALQGEVRDGVVIAVAGALTVVLAFTRLADSVTQNSQALTRERVLREASAALVAAADDAAVDEAVRTAVTQLLPPHDVQRIVFATDDRQLTLQALPAAATSPRPRSWWLDDEKKPGTDPADGTLVCPLWLEPLAVARPSGGALVLAGRKDMLMVSRDALEVLAGQAALALDRISLVEAVGRRDSDLYLRAVIRNTADIMLVIDEDQQIRYASPALHELIGEKELPPFAKLPDLVHPDDRGQIRRALRDEGDGVVYCALQRADETQVMVEATYRDLREDRLVQGYVVTMLKVTKPQDPVEQVPHLEHVDELPAWVNRRSAQHKFRY